jgi:hypothetical protein
MKNARRRHSSIIISFYYYDRRDLILFQVVNNVLKAADIIISKRDMSVLAVK